MTRTLIIGGNRSGKSAHAERLASATSEKQIVYIATAEAGDDEMSKRIAHHRIRRDAKYANWTTVEESLRLGAAIEKYSRPDSVVLIDCLTLWLSNLLFSEAMAFPEVGHIEPPAIFTQERAAFLHALTHAQGDVILVSNEVGQGVIPTGAITRWFIDEAGRLNQSAAAICDRAEMVVAGLPLRLKG